VSIDHTAFAIDFDPTVKRMRGVAVHGNTPFDVPFISELAPNLWQGGCQNGLVLPDFIVNVVSLYPWEKYQNHPGVKNSDYIEMFDSEDQGFEANDFIAERVNKYRKDGPTLVHCQAGLNRSSLIAARALFLNGDFDNGDDIVTEIRARRSPACLCNRAFEREVRSWRR
jgi:protein-tyrosine phosphatase